MWLITCAAFFFHCASGAAIGGSGSGTDDPSVALLTQFGLLLMNLPDNSSRDAPSSDAHSNNEKAIATLLQGQPYRGENPNLLVFAAYLEAMGEYSSKIKDLLKSQNSSQNVDFYLKYSPKADDFKAKSVETMTALAVCYLELLRLSRHTVQGIFNILHSPRHYQGFTEAINCAKVLSLGLELDSDFRKKVIYIWIQKLNIQGLESDQKIQAYVKKCKDVKFWKLEFEDFPGYVKQMVTEMLRDVQEKNADRKKSPGTMVAIVVGGVVVLGGALYLLRLQSAQKVEIKSRHQADAIK